MVTAPLAANRPHPVDFPILLDFSASKAKLHAMNIVSKANLSSKRREEPAPLDGPPVVIVAPELREAPRLSVVRDPGGDDADYHSRCHLVALLLDHAGKGNSMPAYV